MSSSIHPTVRVDNPTHIINLTKQVLKVEMSPFEWSHNLICIAHADEIIVGIVKFQVGFQLCVKVLFCRPSNIGRLVYSIAF